VAPALDDSLQAGRAAVRRYAWHEAFEQLTEADSANGGLTPDDLDALAQSAWWTGRLDECIAALERAYALHRDAGEPLRAALSAMSLAKHHYAKGASAVGSAWVARAERLLEEAPESVEHGHLERLRAVIAHEGLGDFDDALGHARRATSRPASATATSRRSHFTIKGARWSPKARSARGWR
jgi:tetratricopeptide (TPR) repeat protein